MAASAASEILGDADGSETSPLLAKIRAPDRAADRLLMAIPRDEREAVTALAVEETEDGARVFFAGELRHYIVLPPPRKLAIEELLQGWPIRFLGRPKLVAFGDRMLALV